MLNEAINRNKEGTVMIYRYLRNYKIQVMETFSITLPYDFDEWAETGWISLNKNRLTIKKGYCCDFATGFPDYEWIKLPSVVHDALKQLMRLELLDDIYDVQVDKILKEMCYERLMNCIKFMASVVYTGVRKFGRFFAKKGKSQDKLYTAV